MRLVHPFPSLLTSSASAGIAALAGGDPSTVARLFFAMLGIQFSIGALNDAADVPLDAIAKPRKPIPSGLVSRRIALGLAGGGGLAGLWLSAVSGPTTLVVAAACLGLGWLYDLRLSRTALSWLPLTLALPLLPVHAWLGAAGSVPAGLVALVPVGVLAGAGLALANGIVDVDRDAQAGRSAIVVALGRRRAWVAQTALLVSAASLALLLAPGGVDADGPDPVAGIRLWSLVIGCALITAGAVVLGSGRPGVRERGWELEAIGVAALGIGWLAGLSTIGGGR